MATDLILGLLGYLLMAVLVRHLVRGGHLRVVSDVLAALWLIPKGLFLLARTYLRLWAAEVRSW